MAKKDILGLDIGTHSIKFLQLKSNTVAKLGIVEISDELLSNLPPDSRDSLIANSIKKLLAENKVMSKNVITSVSGDSVIVRYITLPQMSKEDLALTIKFEAEPHISFGVDQAILDFEILGVSLKEEKKMDVVIVAAKKEIIDRHIALLNDAGLTPVLIDVDAFALETAFEFNRQEESGGSIALIDLGATYTNINILENGVSRFSRDILLGGNNLSKIIARELRIEYKKAELLKKEKGMVVVDKGDTIDNLSESEDDIVNQISEAIRSPLIELVNEIRRSLDYYQAQAHARSISKVVLSGGCSKLQNIGKFIVQEIKVPVEIDNPFKNLQIDSKIYNEAFIKDIAPYFSVVQGLALRSGKK